MVTISLLQPSQPEQRALQSDEECSTTVQLLHSKTRSIPSHPTFLACLWTLAPSLGLSHFSLDLLLCWLHSLTQHCTSLTNQVAQCHVTSLNCWSNAAPRAKISRTGRCGGEEWWPSATLAEEKKEFRTTPAGSWAIQSALLHPYSHFERVTVHLLT